MAPATEKRIPYYCTIVALSLLTIPLGIATKIEMPVAWHLFLPDLHRCGIIREICSIIGVNN